MIQARKLGHIVLKVRDAQKSKEFYVRALGLKLAYEDVERGAVISCTEGCFGSPLPPGGERR